MPPREALILEPGTEPRVPPIGDLQFSDVMPGILRRRRLSPIPVDPTTPSTPESIVDEAQALALFETLVATIGSPEATVLTMMRRYTIPQDVLNSLSGM